jgi:hypothetical protein
MEVFMYARVASFDGAEASGMDATRDQIDSGWDNPPPGLEGARSVWMLFDRENGRGLGITLFETEDDLRRGDEALNAMSPGDDGGQRSGVAVYEVMVHKER